jgi:hypothetical protein
MFARFIESPIDVIYGGTTKMLLRRQARDYSLGVSCLAILPANCSQTRVAARLFAYLRNYIAAKQQDEH